MLNIVRIYVSHKENQQNVNHVGFFILWNESWSITREAEESYKSLKTDGGKYGELTLSIASDVWRCFI